MLKYSPLKEKDAEIFSPQATGISTGSVYKDFALLKNGFVPCFDTNIMIIQNMTQLLLLGKFEYTGGPIFKVVLEC